MKQRLSTILRAAISTGLIALLLYIMRDKYGQILAALKGTNFALFLLAFVAFTTACSLAAFRLCLIIRAQKIPITFPESLSLTFIGYFFNNFLPTSIGGDVVKGYYLSHKSQERAASYTAIFVDRAIGLLTMIIMAFIALFFAGSNVVDNSVRYLIYSITAVSFLGIFFLAHKGFARKFSFLLALARPIEDKIRTIYATIHQYREQKLLMAQSLAISVCSQLLYFVSIAVTALSIGSYISLGNTLLRMPIISAMSLLPSINGLGVREGATVLFFGPIIGKENAFAVSILILAILFITSMIGGIVYMTSPQYKIRGRKTG